MFIPTLDNLQSSDNHSWKMGNLILSALFAFPELRIGQLLVNAAHKGGWNQDDIFYCPDDVIEKGIKLLIEERN